MSDEIDANLTDFLMRDYRHGHDPVCPFLPHQTTITQRRHLWSRPRKVMLVRCLCGWRSWLSSKSLRTKWPDPREHWSAYLAPSSGDDA